jgi:hypothetical protein
MTVRELIAELIELDPDKKVYVEVDPRRWSSDEGVPLVKSPFTFSTYTDTIVLVGNNRPDGGPPGVR